MFWNIDTKKCPRDIYLHQGHKFKAKLLRIWACARAFIGVSAPGNQRGKWALTQIIFPRLFSFCSKTPFGTGVLSFLLFFPLSGRGFSKFHLIVPSNQNGRHQEEDAVAQVWDGELPG